MSSLTNAIKKQCLAAKKASLFLATCGTTQKNNALAAIAAELNLQRSSILQANKSDLNAFTGTDALRDRLLLNDKRIDDIIAAIHDVIALPDPINTILKKRELQSKMQMQKVRVPLGVVAIIYEARPNVTIDSLALCLKAGNSVVLRGGKDAINSNIALAKAAADALNKVNFDSSCVQLITDITRQSATALMRMRGIVDVLVPRGSASLINSVIKNSLIPTIETGTGNCHLYIHNSADINSIVPIVINAKTQRYGVCNTIETLLIDSEIAKTQLPVIANALTAKNVQIRGCNKTLALCPSAIKATAADYFTEFLAPVIAVKVVKNYSEAIAHIQKHTTYHSESILATDTNAIDEFVKNVDAAAVYVNASTRFTDGGQFGLGAELGISTQKLHVRGPIGLSELTTYKYVVIGNGQIRE